MKKLSNQIYSNTLQQFRHDIGIRESDKNLITESESALDMVLESKTWIKNILDSITVDHGPWSPDSAVQSTQSAMDSGSINVNIIINQL